MKDELLIRFIDGNTTPEETELVLKELSQDGSAAKEWLQMVQGARLADTDPIINVDSDDFVAKTLAEKSSAQPERRKTVRLPWLISGITTAAASVAIIATVMVNNMNPEMQQDFMAEVTDTTVVVPEADTTVLEDAVDIKEVSHQAVADVVEPRDEEQLKSPAGAEDQSAGQQQAEEPPLELSGRKMIQDSKTSTASQNEVASFEMVRPAKSPYRVRVKNPENEFVFEWKMSDASNVRLSIADKNGKVIIDNEWILETRYGIVASDLVDRGELDWTVEVTFNDGSMQRKTGKIELVTIKE